jgi:exosortase
LKLNNPNFLELLRDPHTLAWVDGVLLALLLPAWIFVDKFSSEPQTRAWLRIGILCGIVVICFRNTIVGTADAWSTPMYSHGYMIPAFTAFLMYMRREPIEDASSRERWWGAGIIGVAMLLRSAAGFNTIFTLDRVTLLIALLGVFVYVGGFRLLRWAGAPIAFLAFMFPLPGFIVDNLFRPLQTAATISSVYVLQTLGVDVFRDGNRIELEHSPLSVAEQCSGLRMATILIALVVAIVMISNNRPWWERIVVLFSAIPIALMANCIRITATGLLYNLNLNEAISEKMFHDVLGFLMMPIALCLLFLEMRILSNLVIEDRSAAKPVQGVLGTAV